MTMLPDWVAETIAAALHTRALWGMDVNELDEVAEWRAAELGFAMVEEGDEVAEHGAAS